MQRLSDDLVLYFSLNLTMGFLFFKDLQHVVPLAVMGDVLRAVQILAQFIVLLSFSVTKGPVLCHVLRTVHVVGVTMSFDILAFMLCLLGWSVMPMQCAVMLVVLFLVLTISLWPVEVVVDNLVPGVMFDFISGFGDSAHQVLVVEIVIPMLVVCHWQCSIGGSGCG